MKDVREIKIDDFFKCQNIEEKIKFLLQFAILAPSTHNTQPWLFKIQEKTCEVFLDEKYFLPEADPIRRDIHISIGCAIENLLIASKYFGIFLSISYGPFDEKNKIANIVFVENTIVDKTYEKLVLAIKNRINSRGIFSESLNNEYITDLLKEIPNEYFNDGIKTNLIFDKTKIEKIAGLTAEGLRIAYDRKSFRKEMYKWMKNSLTFKKEGIPGYSLKMPFLLSFILPTIVRFFNIGQKLAKLNFKSLNSAPAILIISSDKNEPPTWVKIGRLAERLMLEFNLINLNTSIFVASIEMSDLHKRLSEIAGITNEPQFLFAIGKINEKQRFTPRNGINKKIIK